MKVLNCIVIIICIFNAEIVLATDTHQGKPNRLVDSASPYLRQHAYNPVDWYPWGEEALEKAKKENKPILVSIGYSTCYWCHVMEREIFSKPDIAELMNKNFINIKVDREERPDIDDIYMTATRVIHGRGGWPNNVFITPDLMPFFAGTTFTYSRWKALQQQLADQWQDNQQDTIRKANATGSRIREYLTQQGQIPKASIDEGMAHSLFRYLSRTFDGRNGGFGSGVKFPREMALLFLLDYHRLQNNPKALDMANLTYDHMAMGGIHDHVGGGFHRYSTDREWKVPHFEKMLYNQAMLAKGYTELFKLSNYPHHRKTIEDILFYVERRMTGKDGEFYSALDAETDAVEGAYYAWTEAQLEKTLTKDEYQLVKQLYTMGDIPTFPGHKHVDGGALNLKKTLLEASFDLGISYQELLEKVDVIHAGLRKARDKRKLPRLDDKVIVSWNGIMIDALARAGMTLDKPEYVERAKRSARFILTNMRDNDGGLKRIYSRARAYRNAYFEDYAYFIQGLASLYRATEENSYIQTIEQLISKADTLFLDKARGGYYFTDGTENLIVRLKGADDSAIPSGNAVMAHALLDLYEITGDRVWGDRASSIIDAFSGNIRKSPAGHTHLVHALMRSEALKKQPPKIKQVKVSEPDITGISLGKAAESKDKVNISAEVQSVKGNIATIDVTLRMKEPGWHVNANPASLDFLIPTTVDVQTDATSKVKIVYPDAEDMETPLGTIQVYGDAVIRAEVIFDHPPLSGTELRVLSQFQACKEAICYKPSDIVILVEIK